MQDRPSNARDAVHKVSASLFAARSLALVFVAATSSCTGTVGSAGGRAEGGAPKASAGIGGSSSSPSDLSAGSGPSLTPSAEVEGATAPPVTSVLPYPESVLCPAAIPAPVAGLSTGFASACAGCHGPTGQGQGPFPALNKVGTLDEFISIVRNGRNEMPAFPAVPDAQLAADFGALHAASVPAAAADPDCGPGASELPPAAEQDLQARIAKGMAVFRKVGPKGACAGCHSAAATDLVFIGYSDATILRRAVPNIGPDDAPAIVDMVHALRQKYHVDRTLHPAKLRFMQPGFEYLPEQPQAGLVLGAGAYAKDVDRDRAFAASLRDDVKLLLVTETITSVVQAEAAQAQLIQLDLTQMRTGIPIERWTEDGFRGTEHNVSNEWIPMTSRTPVPAQEAAWYERVDAYLADPTAANLWQYYDTIDTLTVGHEPDYPLAERWALAKYKSVQVAAHMLLSRSLKTPDPFAGAAATDPVERRLLNIAHHPFWLAGDSMRINPLNCNTTDICTKFPASLDATMNAGDPARERMTYEDKVSWFWIGFSRDPALLLEDNTIPATDGDYFLAMLQPYYNVHNAFAVASIITNKANAPADYMTMKGVATTGHGIWASPRPFLAFKQSERELHHPPPTDIRYPIHERIWANTFRMALYLMNDELGRTGQVFDRARTLQNVRFIHHWFGLDLERDRDHSDLDALVAELEQRLAAATEIGTVVATEYGDAPDPVVLPDF